MLLPYADFVKSLFRGTRISSIVDQGPADVVQVSSTCLSEIRYDILTHQLGVTFRESGNSYEYYQVPEDEYQELVASISIGGEYNNIIKGSYL